MHGKMQNAPCADISYIKWNITVIFLSIRLAICLSDLLTSSLVMCYLCLLFTILLILCCWLDIYSLSQYTIYDNEPYCKLHYMQAFKTAGGLYLLVLTEIGDISKLKPTIQCVSKKIPDVFSYNSRKHCRIFIIFGRNISEKVSNQKILYFSTSPN